MNDINNIPCRQLKCVVYPVCKFKTEIDCLTMSHFLNVYFHNELKTDLSQIDPYDYQPSNEDTIKIWSFIRKHLPSAESVTVYNISLEKQILREINLHMTLSKDGVATFRMVSRIKKEIITTISEKVLAT